MRLSTADASFLYLESVSGPMHISSVIVLEGEIDFNDVFAHFEARMHLLPTYRRKLAQIPFNIAHPVWVDDPDFDLSKHILHQPQSPGTSLEDAIDAAVKLNEPLLERNIPLWRTHVITGVPDRTLILHQTHHAMIDGASGVELMAIIYDFDPKGDPVTSPLEAWQAEPTPSAATLFDRALGENLQTLRDTNWSRLFTPDEARRDLTQRATRIMTDFVTRPSIAAPFNAGPVGPHRRLAWMKQPFSEIREIRRAFGGTINDIVLTVVSEAVAQYLVEHDETVKGQHLRIMCPVNVRTEDQQGSLGNQVSGIFPVLPAWPMDAIERLKVVCTETGRIKQNQEAQALTLLQDSVPEPWPIAFLPNQLIGTPFDPTRLAANLQLPTPPKALRPPNIGPNFVCTNVPGPQVPQYLCGHVVTDQIGLLVLSGTMGFSVTILSYNQTLFFGFISEPRLMPDVEKIEQAARATFDVLLARSRQNADTPTPQEQ
ncbi:MAG: WS/DGAT domain-containing protein [Proteobacteria bacterium]|nr:WS/DGAT domain-containing protein [Pseudomonadota bacterium]